MDSLLAIGFIVWGVASWLTHVIYCITASKWIFLLAGAIFFPIGWIHGTGLWFGVF